VGTGLEGLMAEWTEEEMQAFMLINRRRRQLHVHSVMYYFLNTSIVTDATFDKWAVELVELNKQWPQFKYAGYQYNMFEDWTGDTGMHLKVTDEALAMADWLLERNEKPV